MRRKAEMHTRGARGTRSGARALRGIGIAILAGGLIAAYVGPSVAGAALPPVGNNTGMSAGPRVLWESDFERQVELNLIQQSGAKWMTVDIDWASIQPKRGVWNWSYTDKVVREARARGLELIGVLAYSPKWAQPPTCPANTTHCLPLRAQDYARFAVRAVQRYGLTSANAGLRGTIRTWQVWNEANHVPFVNPRVDPAFYTLMLKTTYTAIKDVDVWTRILAAGTAPAPDDPSGRDMQPVTFLNAIYANGGAGYFDAFAHHPSSFPCSPMTNAPWNAFLQTAAIYYSMVMHGDGAKKVWGTEVSAPTSVPAGACESGIPGVSEPVQALLVHDYLTGWNQMFGAFTGPLIWYQIRDNGLNAASVDDRLGLVRRDFTAKPAYQVFSTLMKVGG